MELFQVSAVEGLRSFYKQMLSGDVIDNIPSLYQLTKIQNKKRYSEYIDHCVSEKEMFEVVRRIYAKGYGARDYDDLNCILWELGTMLYMKRTWTDRYTIPK